MAEKAGQHVFQAPTGTRDFYPAELNRLRYIQDAWRRTSINHGFDEIDGPTFEHLDLYTVKSGEGIVSELFSFERFGGEKTFALRPEFTPTLARMYASKAASLPKPTKWFWQQNCFRAERPQRGRLREFSQWNIDMLNTDDRPAARARADAEVIFCCISLFESLGLTAKDVKIHINDRYILDGMCQKLAIPTELRSKFFDLLDRRQKIAPTEASHELGRMGLPVDTFERFEELAVRPTAEPIVENAEELKDAYQRGFRSMNWLRAELSNYNVLDWIECDHTIVRGLAYYTGMVFEAHEASGAERAIAGGGRYDGLIEMFGGPSTSAAGFGMGDVVLSLVLKDKGLLPSDDDAMDKLGLRPDAVVVCGLEDWDDRDNAVAGAVSVLRRAGLHARRSYKTTKNVGKLIQDAAKLRARYCVILESATQATVKNMDSQAQEPCAIADLAAKIRAK